MDESQEKNSAPVPESEDHAQAHAEATHSEEQPVPEDHQRDEGVPPVAADTEAPAELEPEEFTEVDESDVMIAEAISEPVPTEDASDALKAVIEAAIYITDEPLTCTTDGIRARSAARSHQRNSGRSW